VVLSVLLASPCNHPRRTAVQPGPRINIARHCNGSMLQQQHLMVLGMLSHPFLCFRRPPPPPASPGANLFTKASPACSEGGILQCMRVAST